MAKLITKKYQNHNSKSPAFHKWYGRIVFTETMSFDEFINHICSHAAPYSRGTILGVMAAACDCLVELTMDSKKIWLGDLGIFYASAETEGESEKDKFTAENVKGIHLRFLPNKKHTYPLDSKSLRQKASLADLDRIAGIKDDSDDEG
ncbi:MAG: hypothetical protein IJ144_03795 [Prevotella sp.]|nr:hypothetical protein [Prevotella sp.]MBQ9186934.1 hypothetical protein [Prevotella sp.]